MKSALREVCPEVRLHVVKGEHAPGVKQEPSFAETRLGSSLYFPCQQSVPYSGVGYTDPGLVESNELLANEGNACRNV